jgi:predicted Zn finger-like uncharacterized protein
MIVVCSTCHARFKVADEKIGPRGAKVRCSKCQTVFLVHRDLGVMPAEPQQAAPAAPSTPPPQPSAARGMELDLESEPMGGVRPSGFIADPFARAPAADPFTMPSAPNDAADPFSAQPAQPLPQDPFSAAPPDPQADQFASPDPFGGAGGGSFGAVDPFVATVSSATPGLPTSAVTDLSDLIGSPAGTPAPAASFSPAATPAPEPSGILDTGFDFDPSAAPSPELEAAAPPPGPAQFAAPEPDLALAERTPTPGLPVPRSSAPMPGLGDFAGADLFEAQGGLEMDAGPSFGAAEEDAFGGPELVEPPPAAPPPPAEDPALELAEPPAPAAAPEAGPEAAAAVGLRQRSSRVRSLLVNAISLVALVLVAVGILALWRGVRPGGAGIHPRSLFGALSAQPPPFGTSQLRSGLFERSDASPLLFVAGKAVSHGAAAVQGLRVRVELVRKGAVVASGEARAGAVPSSEELYTARDAAAIAALFARLEAKAPNAVKPGDALPFLVAISDFPADISGIGLKVSVEPVGKVAEGKGAPQP